MSARRNFLKMSTLTAGSLLLAPVMKAASSIVSHRGEPSEALEDPGSKYRIRKSVNSLTINDPILASYRKAVSAMMALPDTDPRSWTNQAKIHERYCAHNNWFFLPWHRCYLLAFEELCRELSEDEDFVLPYWNWTAYPQVPGAFWEAGSVLNDKTRRIGPNDSALDEMVGTKVITSISKTDDFLVFAGRKSAAQQIASAGGGLEIRAHNYIHRFIGDDSSGTGHMATMLSPLDPIFWLHHANVDRIWAAWNDAGKPNPSDKTYNDYTFTNNFCDRKGKLKTNTVADALTQRKMGYLYDTQDVKPEQIAFNFSFPKFTALEKSAAIFKLSANEPQAVSFLLSSTATTKIQTLLSEVQNATEIVEPQSVQIVINDVQPPTNDNFLVRVFINCSYLDEHTPINDPHYVSTFTFFGSGHHHDNDEGHDHNGMDMGTNGLKYVFDITGTLNKIQANLQKENLERNLEVKLLSIPLGKGEPAILQTGKVEVVLARRGD